MSTLSTDDTKKLTATSTIMRRPNVFVAAALQFEWFPEQTGIIRELIQLIAAYACTACMSQARLIPSPRSTLV